MFDYITICEKAARAGAAAAQDWVGRFDVQEKGPADLVTQADFASQEAVRRVILEAFPDHAVIGEEKDRAESAQSEFRWIVDPIDGTTNYVHRVPFYCVSLALERAGELIAAVVYNPSSEECFSAVAGRGAWLNGEPIGSSNVKTLRESLAAVGFAPGCKRDSPDLAVFVEALTTCQAIRRTGSCALNLCYVACGRFDVFWSFCTKIWDVAAGVLIVREAGGTVTAIDGGPFVLEDATFLAAGNPTVHEELKQLVERAQK